MEQRRDFVLAKSRGHSISPSVLFPQLLCDVSPCEQWVFAIFRTTILAQLCLSSVTSRARLGHIQWALAPRIQHRAVSGLCPPKLSIFTPELIWDNHSHGICFVCNNIFEPQVSSAQLIPDLSVMTIWPGKTSSGEKASDVCTGQGGPFFSQCLKDRWDGRVRQYAQSSLEPSVEVWPFDLAGGG